MIHEREGERPQERRKGEERRQKRGSHAGGALPCRREGPQRRGRRKGPADRRASEESGPEGDVDAFVADVEARVSHHRQEIARTDPRFVSAEWLELLTVLEECAARLRASGSPRAIKDMSGDLDFDDALSEEDGSPEPTERKWSDADVEAITAVAVAAVTKHYEEKARPSVEAREALYSLEQIDVALYAAHREWDARNMASLSSLMEKHLRATYEGRTDG